MSGPPSVAEQLQELHLALEGAVDQLVRAQRIALGGPAGEPGLEALSRALEVRLAEVVALRNDVRERLLGTLGRRLPTVT